MSGVANPGGSRPANRRRAMGGAARFLAFAGI